MVDEDEKRSGFMKGLLRKPENYLGEFLVRFGTSRLSKLKFGSL